MHPTEDMFGRVHILMAMDLKQLPPATANPAFLAADAEFREHFGYRVLTENRRLAQAKNEEEESMLQEFQQVLEDVAYGRDTALVRKALVEPTCGELARQNIMPSSRAAQHVWRNDSTEIDGTGSF